MKSITFKRIIISTICLVIILSNIVSSANTIKQDKIQQNLRTESKNTKKQSDNSTSGIVNNNTFPSSQISGNVFFNSKGYSYNNPNAIEKATIQPDNSTNVVVVNNNSSSQINSADIIVPISKKPIYEPVIMVSKISAAGKAALDLQNSGGDPEYIKLLQNGFEQPSYTSKIFEAKETTVTAPTSINHLWQPTDPRDANLWQNVEFNRYNNKLLDTTRFTTPAHFTINEEGNTIVHAPSDHGLQIISPATTTVTALNTFLDIEDLEMFADNNLDSELLEEMNDEKTIDSKLENYFLNKN